MHSTDIHIINMREYTRKYYIRYTYIRFIRVFTLLNRRYPSIHDVL